MNLRIELSSNESCTDRAWISEKTQITISANHRDKRMSFSGARARERESESDGPMGLAASMQKGTLERQTSSNPCVRLWTMDPTLVKSQLLLQKVARESHVQSSAVKVRTVT
jgi:hypothetical protein